MTTIQVSQSIRLIGIEGMKNVVLLLRMELMITRKRKVKHGT